MFEWMNSKTFFYLAWLGRMALLVALVYSYVTRFHELTVLTGFLLLSLTPLLFKKKMSHFYDFLFMVIILFNTSSFVWDAYGMVSYYDDIVHFFTPFLIVILSGQFFIRYLKSPRKNGFFLFLTLTGFGVLLGVSWEIIEWVSENTFLPYSVMFGLADTMSDLIWDFIGSSLGGLVYVTYLAGAAVALTEEEKV